MEKENGAENDRTAMRQIPDIGFMRLSEVLLYIPVSKSTFWVRVKAGDYPAPIKISPRVSAWRNQDIKNLMRKMK